MSTRTPPRKRSAPRARTSDPSKQKKEKKGKEEHKDDPCAAAAAAAADEEVNSVAACTKQDHEEEEEEKEKEQRFVRDMRALAAKDKALLESNLADMKELLATAEFVRAQLLKFAKDSASSSSSSGGGSHFAMQQLTSLNLVRSLAAGYHALRNTDPRVLKVCSVCDDNAALVAQFKEAHHMLGTAILTFHREYGFGDVVIETIVRPPPVPTAYASSAASASASCMCDSPARMRKVVRFMDGKHSYVVLLSEYPELAHLFA